MIIGSSGSGKSTLARKLGEITGLPVVHIDKIYWTEGWVMRPMDKIHHMIAEATSAPRWIFEGNNSSTFHLRLARADTLIFLDVPTHICLYRVIKRIITSYGKVRYDMAPGCPERFDWAFLKWVYGYRKSARARAFKLLNNVPNTMNTVLLHNNKSLNEFINVVHQGK